MIELRAHHLLCMQYFVGEGYSKAFTENMKSVLSRVKSGEEIRLKDGADAVCAACPNMENGVCKTDEKVRRYDAKVYEKLQAEPIHFSDFSVMAKQENLLDTVCPDCSWNALCRKVKNG